MPGTSAARLGFAPVPGIGTASARTPSGTTPTADAHWRRPRWISWVPPAPPNASTAPRHTPGRRKSRATNAPVPTGKTACPSSDLIGVGQGGSPGCHRHPQMLQLPLATRQAAANLAQRMRLSQLAKQHGSELAPTGETPRVPFSLVLLDRLFEIPAREQLQHLRENAAYFVHRLSLLRLNWFLVEPNPAYQGLNLSPAATPSASASS